MMRRVPPTGGFTHLHATAQYDYVDQSLFCTAYGTRAEGNLGPVYYTTWTAPMSPAPSDQTVRKDLELALEVAAEKLAQGSLIPHGDFLERCLPSASHDVGEFLEAVCTRCTCPYCGFSPRSASC